MPFVGICYSSQRKLAKARNKGVSDVSREERGLGVTCESRAQVLMNVADPGANEKTEREKGRPGGRKETRLSVRHTLQDSKVLGTVGPERSLQTPG